MPYWHDDIGRSFDALMKNVDALLLGGRTYVTHAEAFEPMPPGDPFGDMTVAEPGVRNENSIPALAPSRGTSVARWRVVARPFELS